MANLLAIAELECRRIFPNPTPAQIAQFVASAKVEYAAAYWVFSKEEEATTGSFEIPSGLLTEVELDVVNNEIDVSKLKILNSLSHDRWLQDVGGEDCDCRYVKSSLAMEKKLCDDDSLPNGAKPFYVTGKKIKFPKGTHADTLKIVYANMGEGVDPRHIECNEYIASQVRMKLKQLYDNKFPEDKTINGSINN
jgi:hypothetical protein